MYNVRVKLINALEYIPTTVIRCPSPPLQHEELAGEYVVFSITVTK